MAMGSGAFHHSGMADDFGDCFATIIGLVSGFYPANRAVIPALEAIKHSNN